MKPSEQRKVALKLTLWRAWRRITSAPEENLYVNNSFDL